LALGGAQLGFALEGAGIKTGQGAARAISGGTQMQMGPWQLLLIAAVVLVLFGRGKVSSLMGEVGKGITAFKKGVKDGSEEIEKAQSEAARDVTPSDKDKA
jgi:sec-independent protein translocase protein TatA